MNRIVTKQRLQEAVTLYELEAPLVARKARAGQFVILRVEEEGERIPITIHDSDPEKGTITLIVQTVGATTRRLERLEAGESLAGLVGPLGRATETRGRKTVCVVGGGVGSAIAYPVLKQFRRDGARVHGILGFQNRQAVLLEEVFRRESDLLTLCTDDGSYGCKGLVTQALERLLEEGNRYDEVYAVGPMAMMRAVCRTTRPYGLATTVSMNPIMIDGTGMCGGCRLSVGGALKFACVDGPEFDGHQVDWDLAMERSRMYADWEACRREETCRLLREEGA